MPEHPDENGRGEYRHGHWFPQPHHDGRSVRVLRNIEDGEEEFYTPDGGSEMTGAKDGVWRPQADDAAREQILAALPEFIEEAVDMAGWADVTTGATAAHRVFMAQCRRLQAALDALTPATTPPTDGGAR